jgi:hypothetical protein
MIRIKNSLKERVRRNCSYLNEDDRRTYHRFLQLQKPSDDTHKGLRKVHQDCRYHLEADLLTTNLIVPMYTCMKCVCVLLFLDLIGIVGGVLYSYQSMMNTIDSTVHFKTNKEIVAIIKIICV